MYEELLEIIKQRLLPEIQEMKEFRAEVRAELRVINSRLDVIEKRLDGMDRRFEQIERRVSDLHDDLREVRSYAFTSRMHEGAPPYQVREPGK